MKIDDHYEDRKLLIGFSFIVLWSIFYLHPLLLPVRLFLRHFPHLPRPAGGVREPRRGRLRRANPPACGARMNVERVSVGGHGAGMLTVKSFPRVTLFPLHSLTSSSLATLIRYEVNEVTVGTK